MIRLYRMQYVPDWESEDTNLWLWLPNVNNIKRIEFETINNSNGSNGSNTIQKYFRSTKGAQPRRADARLGSAHARNYRGCTRRQIEAVNATILPRGTQKINRFGIKRKCTLGSDSMNQKQFCQPRHKMTNSSSNNSSITHRAAAAAAAAALCMHINKHIVHTRCGRTQSYSIVKADTVPNQKKAKKNGTRKKRGLRDSKRRPEMHTARDPPA